MTAPVRAMIVDDEPLARAHLASLLAAHAEVEVIGTAGDGSEAVAAIERLQPELVFLDVAMPGLDGFDVLGELDRDGLPLVVFTTAYDEHALRAFEAEAVDYLLKPIEEGRLADAIRRALRILRGVRSSGGEASARFRTSIAARSGKRVVLLVVDDIDRIESVGNYAKLRVGAHSYYLRSTLTALEQELDPARFVRIHRAAIVNLERVAEVSRGVDPRDYVVVLRNGERLEMQRTFAGRLRALVGRF